MTWKPPLHQANQKMFRLLRITDRTKQLYLVNLKLHGPESFVNWRKLKKKKNQLKLPWKAAFNQPFSIDSSSASRPYQHLYLSLCRRQAQPVLTQHMLYWLKNIYCTPSLCHTPMRVRHSSTQRCQTFQIRKVPCSGIWPVISSLSINSLPGEASLPRPSLWMIREVLCIHATQQPPCQNQVYIYPGLTWDFLALSCSFLQRNHKCGEGGFL